MKFHSLRTSLMGCAFMLVGALLLGSCGGGGAATTNSGGNLAIFPSNATFYAGMPGIINVQGGRRPYRIVSSEPGILPVPAELDGTTFTVIPSNPGVIDVGSAPGDLPVRTVLVTVSDAANGQITATIRVAQNFLTGYSVFYTSNCPAGSAGSPSACSGGETAVRIEANFGGALIGNRQYRLDILRGPFQWVFSPGGAIIGNSVTVVTDHEGKTNAIFRVNNNVPTQIGVFRITDVETGVSTEQIFVIQMPPQAATELTILPDQITFGGANSASCGTGSADVLVFDGVPPYTATSSFTGVTVVPTTSSTQPGRFTITATNPGICLNDATIVIQDSNNARGTVTLTTEPGEGDPPVVPTPLRAVPNVLTLNCGDSASVLIVGGDDPAAVINAVSNDPDVTAMVAGRTVQITRNNVLGNTEVPPTVASTVTATDGAQTVSIRVNNPTDCVP